MKIIAKFFVLLFCSITILFSQTDSLVEDSISINPQRKCYTMQLDSIHNAKYGRKSIITEEKMMKKIIDSNTKRSALLRTQADTILIPVIVHVIHNGEPVGTDANLSAEQIHSQFEVLNEDFNKKIGSRGHNTNPVGVAMLIKFVPANKSPNGLYLEEPGIHRVNANKSFWTFEQIEDELKTLTGWNPTQYFNIWTVKFGGSLSSTLGYTQFPSLSKLNGLETDEGLAGTDGVVIRFNVFGRIGNVKSPYHLGRTLTHEVGHFFGLRHIWGDESDCQGTDYCNDTPPTSDAYYGCPTSATSCLQNVAAMYQNYMDYTNDACMNIFTNNQRSRIMAVLQNSPRRKELPDSDALNISKIPKADFSVDKNSVCMGNTIVFADKSKRLPLSWLWNITDHTNAVTITASSQNFSYLFDKPNLYSAQLIVQNIFGKDTLVRKDYIQVLDTIVVTLPYLQDFESTTPLRNWVYPVQGNWAILNTVDQNQISSKSLCLNGAKNQSNSNKVTEMISPKFDFQTFQNAYLTFDLSYQYQYSTIDTLAIYYSTNCGQTYTMLWRKSGKNLATWTEVNTIGGVSTTLWRTEQINLDLLNFNKSVHFKIVHNALGNNSLFLDNISIKVPNRTSVPTSNFLAPFHVICLGENIQFSDQSTQYPTTWKWKFSEINNQADSLLSYDQNPDIKFAIAGIYTVALTTNNTIGLGNTATKIANLTVNSNPIITLIASKSAVICGNEVVFYAFGGNKYAWYSDRNIEPITTITTFTFSNSIKYTSSFYVLGTDRFGCSSLSNSVKIAVEGNCELTTITQPTRQKRYTIFPNPANKYITIARLENDLDTSQVFQLYSLLGKKIITQKIENELNTIDISGLEKGLYYYSVGNEQGKLVIID